MASQLVLWGPKKRNEEDNQDAPWPAEALRSVRPKRWVWWTKLRKRSLPAANFSGVTMQNLCHVMLGFLFCQSALLVKPSVRFQPLQLNLTEGETAKFTCFISNIDFKYGLNWYKRGHDHQPVKLDCDSRKYSVSKLDNQTYKMEVRDLQKNDSGTYYCWVNSFDLKETIMESNRANLTVTAAAIQPPEEITPVEEKGEGDGTDANTPLATFRGSGLLVLLVVLYFFVWNLRRRRQEQEKQKDRNAPSGEDAPAVTVFTVDYEMLEFPRAQKTSPASPKDFRREQTEYATLSFLPKTPAVAELGDLNQTPCPARMQPS
ncbi:programmed cell death protein 1 [Liasis olivaceus]